MPFKEVSPQQNFPQLEEEILNKVGVNSLYEES